MRLNKRYRKRFLKVPSGSAMVSHISIFRYRLIVKDCSFSAFKISENGKVPGLSVACIRSNGFVLWLVIFVKCINRSMYETIASVIDLHIDGQNTGMGVLSGFQGVHYPISFICSISLSDAIKRYRIMINIRRFYRLLDICASEW